MTTPLPSEAVVVDALDAAAACAGGVGDAPNEMVWACGYVARLVTGLVEADRRHTASHVVETLRLVPEDDEDTVRRCTGCGHEDHHDTDCGEVVGYDHINGDHECGCPGDIVLLPREAVEQVVNFTVMSDDLRETLTSALGWHSTDFADTDDRTDP